MKAIFKQGRYLTLIEVIEAEEIQGIILKLKVKITSIRTVFKIWYGEKPVIEVAAIVPYSG